MNTLTRTSTDIESEQQLRKQVEKAFEELNNKLHGSAERTFDDLLEWIVNGFHIGGKGIGGWRYTPEQTAFFLDTFKALVSAMNAILKTRPWYDFLGNIYETFVAGILRKRGAGQFFTPMNVADCMAKIAKPENGESICDPCCGSGRMLLAAHAENPGAVLYAQDLDRTCVMMTVVNFLLHGCRGRVVWGNSLTDESREVWVVNPDDELVAKGLTHCILLDTPKS